MLTFATAVFLLIITPGPGVLSAAGMGAAYGFRPGLRYVFGLFIGTNMVAFAVISGLAAIVLGMPLLRTILLFLSMGYLLYLAARVAFAGSKIAFIEARTPPGIRAALFLQAINPKAYVVNTTFFTGFAFMPESLALETILKLIIINAIWIPIHLVWLYAGFALQKMNVAPGWQRGINVMMALAMVTVVVLAGRSLLE